jgi:hypothetical protein
VAFDALSWAVRHWAAPDDRIDLIATGMEWDISFQGFLNHQFYGDSISCLKKGGLNGA